MFEDYLDFFPQMIGKIRCDARIVEGCLKPILMRIYCASYQLKRNAFFSKVIVKEAKSFKFGKEGEVGYM